MQARLLVLIQGPHDNAVPHPPRQKQTAWLVGWSKSVSQNGRQSKALTRKFVTCPAQPSPVQAISQLDEISKGMETTRDAPPQELKQRHRAFEAVSPRPAR